MTPANRQTPDSTASHETTQGFFALFDVLGYTGLNRELHLDQLVSLYHDVLAPLRERTLTLDGLDPSKMLLSLRQPQVSTLAFSDTIALYQPEGSGGWLSEPSLLPYSCVLLRLAFEAGIPVRGAISYGEYYVHETTLLGSPIVEAYEAEQSQDWSGAVLCDSATARIRQIAAALEQREPLRGLAGLTIDLSRWFQTARHTFLFRYQVPSNSGARKASALCWGDRTARYVKLYVPTLNKGLTLPQIEERVRAKFNQHGKTVDPSVQRKITNTAQFLEAIRHRFIPNLGLQYTPPPH